tara:strand:+ start:203 stop:475 length:273 start_codon:yes stop_codon:yes gene_type:complete
MRIYTCIYRKNGKTEARDVTGPFDRKTAIEHANKELDLDENDELYALVPGQHTRGAWVIDGTSQYEKAKNYKSGAPHSGVTLQDYVPNGF